jgi:flagellar hook assembly protein FlgD
VISFALALAILGPATLSAKKAPYNGEYTMETLALKGPDVTDVYATFSTSDPVTFPIPDALKKLQVKIKDEEGEVAFIKNAWDVEVTDNVATMSADEPIPHETLYVKAHIKTSKQEVVLQGESLVLMRPDLVIDSLAVPSEVVVDEHFVVKAYIREANAEIGATATVSLFIDGEFLTAVTEAEIGPGEPVTFAFAGISIADPGTHELGIVISDADPAEYDDTNNEASISIEVIQRLQTSSYNISYTGYTNYYYYYRYNYCWGPSTYTREQGSWDDLSLHGSSYGLVPNAPIETVSWTVESEKGVHNTGAHTNVAPASTNEQRDYYSIFDQATWTLLTIDVNKLTGWTSFDFSQFSGSRLYIHYYWWQSTYEYKSTATFMNARQFVNVSLLFDDDAVIIGGTATANLGPVWHYSGGYYQSGRCGFWGGRWSRSLTHYYDRVTGYGSGTMDPASLLKGRVASAAVAEALPNTIRLANNYPNPFNPSTKLRFDLPEAAPVSLIVYDLAGGEVARLVDGYVEAGRHEMVWDGRMASGATAPTGVYLARMVTPGYARTIKMVMMK